MVSFRRIASFDFLVARFGLSFRGWYFCFDSAMSYQDFILRKLDSLKDQAKDALWAVTSCICKPAAKIKINGRTCL